MFGSDCKFTKPFFIKIYFGNIKIPLYLQPHLMRGGALAQLVEQWTENPCVPGSIPGGTTVEPTTFYGCGFFILYKSSPK